MTIVLHHEAAEITIESRSSGKSLITVTMSDSSRYLPHKSCLTAYPPGLIEKILKIQGPAWLCDDIMRDEAPEYVQNKLQQAIEAYVPVEDISGKAILDFGCGTGASSMILARLFPEATLTGIELDEKNLSVARARQDYYGYKNINFIVSPSPASLPAELGLFDYIIFSAVFEHMLPAERVTLLPLLWKLLKPGGVFFLNETPYRYFPIETHTTDGLLFINYLPDRLALSFARKFSKNNFKNENWETLLRRGIRGGSVREIRRILNSGSGDPQFLRPRLPKVKDRIDLWFRQIDRTRHYFVKVIFYGLIKAIKCCTGLIMLPYLTLAIQKKDQN